MDGLFLSVCLLCIVCNWSEETTRSIAIANCELRQGEWGATRRLLCCVFQEDSESNNKDDVESPTQCNEQQKTGSAKSNSMPQRPDQQRPTQQQQAKPSLPHFTPYGLDTWLGLGTREHIAHHHQHCRFPTYKRRAGRRSLSGFGSVGFCRVLLLYANWQNVCLFQRL